MPVDFKVGDIVYLKSTKSNGNVYPKMTVIKVDTNIVCQFWNDGLFKFDKEPFPPDALNKLTDGGEAPQIIDSTSGIV